MDQLLEVADISRIMVRLLLKLENNRTVKSETLPFNQEVRSFDDLLSHADKIDSDDECAVQIYDTIKDIVPSVLKSWEHFTEAYGKLIINSFEVSGDDDEKVGWALYLGPSIMG